ncbi:MAG: class I SAM-dependent methyltransferase [Anaerolineae bacterium]|nr:class I SAM-dependent methyltransferase [Anaerolineae bacterium]
MSESDNATPHVSTHYDRQVRETIPFYETMQHEAVDLVQGIKPQADCWLDTGCGTGYLLELALSRFPRTRFLLADPAEAMLAQARARLEAKAQGRVTFLFPVCSQDLAACLDRERPDVVTAIQCHHYLDRAGRRAAVEACFAVLKDEGLFVTIENIAPATERGVRIGLERWGRFQRAQGRSDETVAAHLLRYNAAYYPITLREHLELLQLVGFRTVELFWYAQMQAGLYAIK